MTTEDNKPTPSLDTRLVQLGRPAHGLINPPVERGSTISFPTMAALRHSGQQRYEHALSYGTYGTGTQFHLQDAIAAIEGGARCQVVSSGLTAITVPLLALLSTGDHLIVVDSAYGPTRRFCDDMLRRFGIETTYYDPRAAPADLASLFRPTTRLLLTESPGSNTFEMQDVAALAQITHAHGALLLLDNTWGLGIFQPFAHGVDLSIQALTKYAGGHADILLGAYTVTDETLWRRLRDTVLTLGETANPDECWLALRGLRTLSVRLDRQSKSSLQVAAWLRTRTEIARILHPALPGAPGHDLWRRDYTGSASLFAIEFQPDYTARDVDRFVDHLALFAKGWSWGGFESLANTISGGITRTHGIPAAGPLCRLHIGLESPEDLMADLASALDHLAQ
jgi:cystathionine beta-lyase